MRDTIFNTIEQLREFITVDTSSDLEVVLPYLLEAEKYVKDITGVELYGLLVTEIKTPTGEQRLVDLLPYAQLPLANFGYYKGIDKLNVNIGNAGITVASTNSLVPASKERIDKLRESFMNSGMDALEQLIQFLEENKNSYSEWESSDAYSYQRLFFVNNAKDFKDSIQRQIGRYEFLEMREFMYLAHIDVQEAIGDAQYTELKEQFEGDILTEANLKLMKYIKPGVCYLALSRIEQNKHWKEEGEKRIKQLRDFLNSNPDDYPKYVASDNYEEQIVSELNTEESGLFGFGI